MTSRLIIKSTQGADDLPQHASQSRAPAPLHASARSPLALAAALSASLAAGLLAERAQAEETHRSHAAHEHGSGQLDIAIDGGRLEAMLRLPAMDMLGFEHAPENAEQRASVERALALLRDAGQMLQLPSAADCKPSGAEAQFTGDEDYAEHHEEHHDDEHHDDEHHDDEHHDEAHAEDEAGHSELHAHWQFACNDIAQLDALELGLFEHASSERIQVQLVGPSGQTAATLTPADRQLKLAP